MGQSGHAQGRTKSVSAARTTRRTMSRWRGRSTHADVAGVPSQRGRRGGARATCPHMNGFHYATAHVLVPAAAIRNGAQFLGDPDCLVAALAFSGRAMTNAVRHRARRYSAPHENFGKSSLTGCARISMGIDSLVLAWDRSVARVCARGRAGRPLSKRVQSSLFISRLRSLLPLLDFPNAANASSQGPNAISMPLRAEPHFHLRAKLERLRLC